MTTLILVRYVVMPTVIFNSVVAQMSFSTLQGIGYYIACDVSEHNPGIVCLLAGDAMHLIVFPFVNGREALINAVCIPFPSFLSDITGLVVLLMVVCHKEKATFCYEYPGKRSKVPKMGLRKTVHLSDLDAVKSELQDKTAKIREIQLAMERIMEKYPEFEREYGHLLAQSPMET